MKMKTFNAVLFVSLGLVSFGQSTNKDEIKRAKILENPENYIQQGGVLSDELLKDNGSQAQKAMVEAELMPERVKTDLVRNISANLPANADDKEFEKRAKIAELILKEREIISKEQMVGKQMKMQ